MIATDENELLVEIIIDIEKKTLIKQPIYSFMREIVKGYVS